jgi:hypothetical protein
MADQVRLRASIAPLNAAYGLPTAPTNTCLHEEVGYSIGQNGVEFAHEQPDGKDPSLVADR